MEVHFSLSGGGMLTLRTAGEQVECCGERPDDGKGLYKGYLIGPSGRLPLGAFLPEGGRLILRRTVSQGLLQSRGVWPPTAASAELAFSAGRRPQAGRPAPSGWTWKATPGHMLSEVPLTESLGEREGLWRSEPDGFALAFPFDENRPFPLSPLFCLARVQLLDGRPYAVFSFTGDGDPRLPHKADGAGNNKEASQTKQEKRRGQSDRQRAQSPVRPAGR